MVRKAFLVISVVGGYCFLETIFLLSYLLLDETYPGSYSPFALLGFAQFLILPGSAVLYSRLMYGRQQWGRRALILYLAGTVGVPAMVVIFLLPLGLLAWVAEFNNALGFILLPLVAGGMIWGFFFAIRKTGERCVQIEASRWLAERQTGIEPGERKWRNRGIGWSLWIPSLMVLAVFLFLPEIWGVLTRVRDPHAGHLPGYRISIPATWVILSRSADSATGRSSVIGLAGRGMRLGVTPFFGGRLPLFNWDLWTEPYSQFLNPDDRFAMDRWQPADDLVIDRRVLTLGNVSLTCLDYALDHFDKNRIGHNSSESQIAYVTCSGPDRLHAHFAGERVYVPAFYKMLATTTKN